MFEPTVEVLEVPEMPGIVDPITVFWRNWEPGVGEVTLTCYGNAWTCWFGAMSGRTIQQFFLSCGNDYLINKLGISEVHRRGLKEQRYLNRVIDSVKAYMRAQAGVA